MLVERPTFLPYFSNISEIHTDTEIIGMALFKEHKILFNNSTISLVVKLKV